MLFVLNLQNIEQPEPQFTPQGGSFGSHFCGDGGSSLSVLLCH